jgi:formylglycine-generating enzyme required for sulfatase activity
MVVAIVLLGAGVWAGIVRSPGSIAPPLRMSERGEIELVAIPAGQLIMGAESDDPARGPDEGPLRVVEVAAFEIGRYPVTQEQYGRFLAAVPDVAPPPHWGDAALAAPRLPVVGVSWEDAVRFATWAGGRLPTEAEWEYAARAGSRLPYVAGPLASDLGRAAWHAANTSARKPVGLLAPNLFGLYDMLGNVWEWVEDDYHARYEGAPRDARAWVDTPRGVFRVLRGGSWRSQAASVRASVRSQNSPDTRHDALGFRLARDAR